MIEVTFGRDSLIFRSAADGKSVSHFYRDYPEILGHPRFLMADIDQSVALVRKSVRMLKGIFYLMPPKVFITIERAMQGGLTDVDKRSLAQIFMRGGSRQVTLKDAAGNAEILRTPIQKRA